MSEPTPHNWHQQTWVRVLVLLLLPIIIASLYLLTNLLALRRPPSRPSPTPASPALPLSDQ